MAKLAEFFNSLVGWSRGRSNRSSRGSRTGFDEEDLGFYGPAAFRSQSSVPGRVPRDIRVVLGLVIEQTPKGLRKAREREREAEKEKRRRNDLKD
mmetsp:Transcript_22567/g.44335  ORF Transcript_22567/g.44335 Transcript_22567/m.44335 type:complete len:95 (-) Transcript_22567:149-433(-)